ncbi:M16 family metallopeptidase [Ereboglobus luteus]|nr:M16 family metallopeptidase [Ereboglobus luteus]
MKPPPLRAYSFSWLAAVAIILGSMPVISASDETSSRAVPSIFSSTSVAPVISAPTVISATSAPRTRTKHTTRAVRPVRPVRVAPTTPAIPWPHEITGETPSPRVTYGHLPNGFRYAIIPTGTTWNHVSFRLLVEAGSLHENDAELGYAHFVEHMTFNSTTNYKPYETAKRLQRHGAAIGPDTNAFTSHFETLYKIDLSANSREAINLTLSTLADIAGGALFKAEDVERERGVILAEKLSRQSLGADAWEIVADHLFAGTLFPKRNPIGTDDSLKNATPENLRAFYDAWYRPERMTLVVAGNASASAIERSIKSAFFFMAARAAPHTPPAPGKHDPPKPGSVSVRFLPELETGIIIFPTASWGETARRKTLKDDIVQDLLQFLLDAEMSKTAERSDHAITRFFIAGSTRAGISSQNAIMITFPPDRWRKALADSEQTLRRAIEHGFAPSLVELAKERILQTYQANASRSSILRRPRETADAFLKNLLAGRGYYNDEELLAQREEIFAALTAGDCRDALRALWFADPAHALIFAPESSAITTGAAQAVLDKSRSTPVQHPEDTGRPRFAYTDFGTPGEVVSREQLDYGGIWHVRFSNGVRLNIKQTPESKDSIQMVIRFGGAIRENPPDKPGLYAWGLGLMAGGLKKQESWEVRLAMPEMSQISLHNTANRYTFSASGRSSATGAILALCAAFMQDAAYRPSTAETVRATILEQYEKRAGTAKMVFEQAISPLIHNNPQVAFPPKEQILAYTMDDLKEWMSTQLDPARMDISIVGDCDIEEAIAAAARTIGALPALKNQTPPPACAPESPPVTPCSEEFTFAATNRPAQIDLFWSVPGSEGVDEDIRLMILAEILNDRVRAQIRETEGRAYTPFTRYQRSEVTPLHNHIHCTVQVPPGIARQIAKEIKTIAATLSEQGVDGEELERARRPVFSREHAKTGQTDYWLHEVLADSQTRPEKIQRARRMPRVLTEVTAENINALAGTHLKNDRLLQFIIMPESAKMN